MSCDDGNTAVPARVAEINRALELSGTNNGRGASSKAINVTLTDNACADCTASTLPARGPDSGVPKKYPLRIDNGGGGKTGAGRG
jgi:hypothetical protein